MALWTTKILNPKTNILLIYKAHRREFFFLILKHFYYTAHILQYIGNDTLPTWVRNLLELQMNRNLSTLR